MTSINVPISIGELIDKITILEIKSSKIKDKNKLENVKNELEKLNIIEKEIIKDEINNLKNELKEVNLKLWDIENAKRQHEADKRFDEEFITLARNVYIFNDKRAEIKRKINDLSGSEIVEEKEFEKKKKAFYLGHLGLGDHILCNGLIRTLSENFDEVLVICKNQNRRNVEMMFSDDKKIKIKAVNDDKDISPMNGFPLEKFLELTKGYYLILNGYNNFINHINGKKNIIYDFPFCFYDELNIQRTEFWNKFKLPEFHEANDLYEKVNNMTYVFIHNSWSRGVLFDTIKGEEDLKINKDEILIINPNINHYDTSHKYYTLAESFKNLPLFHYIEILKNARKILITDSAFFCLALQLELKTDECYFYQRPERYFNTETFYNSFDIKNRKKFKSLN